ncbi:hypothetical protein FE257_002145 [Aspergillus nanangensis]|uniref:Uncharacterized protein n=1 Tax=Aspergillus nanangensis TaxID=2582783 RepID=A0AAD4CV65_ASPNN|nr:hypothetical protein FE257_002145 [Aspergillus nanangensis]
MSISKSETDIILNKANVALARSQRLVASWLPAQTAGDSNTKSEEELQREEDEIFTAVPETLGVGAPLPTKAADGSWNRTELDSNDKLRKQLLGKNYKKVMAASSNAATNSPTPGQYSGIARGDLSVGGAAGPTQEEDEDEDEGRTAVVGKRKMNKKRKAAPSPETATESSQQDHEGGGNGDKGSAQGAADSRPASGAKGRKKTSFLDEILGERSKKKKKR